MRFPGSHRNVLPATIAGRITRLTSEAMKFIEMTGKSLRVLIAQDELHVDDLESAGVQGDTILQTTEYFHPRVEEFCGAMPARIGRYIEERPKLAAFIDRRINRGRRIRTDSFSGFAALWLVGGMRRWRRALLRHQVEQAHLERWYDLALDHVAEHYALAVEILNCRRLIKGYSDTHVRAQSKFDRVLSALPMLKGRADAADWLRRLREAALKDEKGDMLDGALKTVATLDDKPA